MLPVQKVIRIYQSSMNLQDRNPSSTKQSLNSEGYFTKKSSELTSRQQSFQDILKKKLQK